MALLAGGFLPLVGQIPSGTLGPKSSSTISAWRGNKDDAAFATLPQVVALARHPNIAVKVTGGPQHVTDTYPFKSLQKHYRAVYDAFGPRRMFWGTDITRTPCTWKECVTHFTEHQPWFAEADKALIMGQAMPDWIGWTRQT